MSRNHVKHGLNGNRWKRTRRRMTSRDKYRCRNCGRPGRLEVDHILPVSRGGSPWDPGNLQTLCRACHIDKTRQENEHHNPDRDKWRAFVRELDP